MAIEPSVLLLDEPFGALDAKVRKDLRRWLREFHDRTGHTTFFVTHDEEALELADRVVVMSQGKVEQVCTVNDVYDRPNSAFVFSFIGESSHLPVKVQDDRCATPFQANEMANLPLGRSHLRPSFSRD
jgi:sulfate transport system ATP-binding protein